MAFCNCKELSVYTQVPSGRRVTGAVVEMAVLECDGLRGEGGGRSVTDVGDDDEQAKASASTCRRPSSVNVHRSRLASTYRGMSICPARSPASFNMHDNSTLVKTAHSNKHILRLVSYYKKKILPQKNQIFFP